MLAAAAAAKRKRDEDLAVQTALDTWSRFARDRGLAFSTTRSSPEIAGTILGIPCRAWMITDRNGFVHTTLEGVPIQEIDGHVGVVPNPGGALGFVKHLVTQDVAIGDEEFDDAFLVRAKPESFARELLGPALRAYISPLAVRKMASFVYEARRVALHFSHVEVEAEWIGAGFDAVVEAARFTRPHHAPFR
ncbi:hypothetical protein BH09MYX1_BH09MYX1_59850 [soil metagenome]